jgi:hypothetical protein
MHSHGLALGQYAMGWCVDRLGATPVVWHSGTLPSYGAFMALLPERGLGVVLLFNVCHHWLNPVLAEFGLDVTALLAGEQRAPLPVVGLIPALLRAQLLLPALQAAGVAAALRPARRRQAARSLALAPHLLALLALLPLLGKRRAYLKLYMPDYAWLAQACGGFALLWGLVAAGLALRARRKAA